MSQVILQSNSIAKIHLLPGDFYFGDQSTRIHTILGSCVSIAVWHPLLRIGGMSHSVLPSRSKKENYGFDGHYVVEAVELLLLEISRCNTRPGDYQVKLTGGSSMFKQPVSGANFNVGENNIKTARGELEAGGFNIHGEHVGGSSMRNVAFDLSNGSLLVKCKDNPAIPAPPGPSMYEHGMPANWTVL